ncbi:MAG: CidA/LrgA family protein [Pseudomonadota bacterium]
MKVLRQIIILLLFVFIGELLNQILKLPIPGNILGMVLLLLALVTGLIKLEQVEDISRFLLDHLSVLFIPAGVGLLAVTGRLADTWYLILLISVFTTFLVMAVTGIVVKLLRR